MLLAAPAGAAPRGTGVVVVGGIPALSGPVADWLLGWWLRATGWGARTAAPKLINQPKNGCVIDPHGLCVTGASTPSEAGCIADPDGHCIGGATTFSDAGCILDPSGHCRG
jgi:hypothetical protein